MIARALLSIAPVRKLVRWLAGVTALLAMLVVAGIGGAVDQPPDEPPPPAATPSTLVPPLPLPETYAGRDAKAWHAAYLAEKKRNAGLRRTLLHHSSVVEALNLACAAYGSCSTLWRRARCESKLYRYAANAKSSARGLFQFLTTGRVRRYGDHAWVNGGTWATTPYWRFDVFSPYANALAAGWMIEAGRGGEWECR